MLQAALEGGRDVSASLARWIPLLEALASGTRFSSGPVRVWCVLRRTSHPATRARHPSLEYLSALLLFFELGSHCDHCLPEGTLDRDRGVEEWCFFSV